LVYQSAGRDDHALKIFLNARSFMSGIAVDSPDRVLPYAGIGSVCYHVMEYEWAIRCFLKVRSVREKT